MNRRVSRGVEMTPPSSVIVAVAARAVSCDTICGAGPTGFRHRPACVRAGYREDNRIRTASWVLRDDCRQVPAARRDDERHEMAVRRELDRPRSSPTVIRTLMDPKPLPVRVDAIASFAR